MKKISFYQVKKQENMKGFNCDLTLEVNFNGKTYYGDLGGYDHHTPETEMNPSPANDERIHNISAERLDKINKVLINDDDLDIYFSALALVYNEELHSLNLFNNSTIWSSVETVDKNGVRVIEEGLIPPDDVYVMEAIWAAKKARILPSFYQKENVKIYNVTDIMYEHLNFIYVLLTEKTNYYDLIDNWKDDLRKKINQSLIVEDEQIRVFEASVPVNSAYFSEKYNKKASLILSYNPNTYKIRLSCCDGKYDCRSLVQQFWGSAAGGHPGIGVSPRNKEMSHLDLFEFHEFIKKHIKA